MMLARRLAALQRLGRSAAGFALILAAWQWGAEWLGIPAYILPLPSAIAARFWETRAVQLEHLGVTAMTTVLGLAIALFVGVLLALAVIYVKALQAIVMPILAAFNSVPKIAIAPLFVIWFGLGLEPKIVLAFLLALFPVFVNSVTGLAEIERHALPHLSESAAHARRAIPHRRRQGRLPPRSRRLDRRRVHRRQQRDRLSHPLRPVQPRYAARLRGARLDHRLHDAGHRRRRPSRAAVPALAPVAARALVYRL